MEWSVALQNAIDYMEEHLTEPLECSEIAKQACVSTFYFQRIFQQRCGCTVGQYIRWRRLSLAGADLLSTDNKVIDIALQYGYSTPESFTRAFTQFHGMTPTAVRNRGKIHEFSKKQLIWYNRAGGGYPIVIRWVQNASFRFLVKSQEVIIDEMSEDFWNQFPSPDIIRTLENYREAKGQLGGRYVVLNEGNYFDDSIIYSIGVEFTGTKAPSGYEIKEIGPHTWVTFSCRGPAWKIWEFLDCEYIPSYEYQQAVDLDIGVYAGTSFGHSDENCEWWFPIQKTACDKMIKQEKATR